MLGENVRLGLFRDAFNALRLARRSVYRCSKGMPSGIPGTTVFNSVGNLIMFLMCFSDLAKEHDSRYWLS